MVNRPVASGQKTQRLCSLCRAPMLIRFNLRARVYLICPNCDLAGGPLPR